MRILVSGATRTVERYARTRHRDRLGVLLTPAAGNSVGWAVSLGLPWAVDNSAFSDPTALPKFPALLDACAGKPGCLWVAAPDVVCDAAATLDLFGLWRAEIVARGLPVALVAQNGLERMAVPWDHLDCLFVGGDDGFKDGKGAAWLCRAAKRRKKLVHVGRVNSERRVRIAADLQADTIDGTGISMAPDTNLPKTVRWVNRAAARTSHPELF